MRQISRLCFLIVALFSLACLYACSKNDETTQIEPTSDDEETVVDMLPKAVPIKLTDHQKSMVNKSNDFSFRLFKQTNGTNKSRILSPLSVAYVLGMLNDGAEGETSRQIMQVLGFDGKSTKEINEFCANILENLPKVDENVKLNIANAMFVNDHFSLRSGYKEDLQNYYKAAAEALIFSSSSAADYINSWCDKNTNGMITKILDKTDPAAVAYLLNAIYFKATWTEKFDEKNTKTEPFRKDDGTTVDLPMMHRYAEARYCRNAKHTTLCLPYSSGAFNMLVLLPEEGVTVNQVADMLDEKIWNTNMADMSNYEVDIKIPRFTSTFETSLTDILSSMGMVRPFTPLAEFPNVVNEDNLCVSEIKQSAKIIVNEEGTEAAAVTIGSYTTTSVSEPKTAVFHADRPFLYAIQENTSGLILFVGTFTAN